MAAEVEGGGALVATNEVAALATRVANIVVVALAFKITTLSFAISSHDFIESADLSVHNQRLILFEYKPTWPLVVRVQHEGVPGLLQVHVGLVPLRVTPRRGEQCTHLGHDRAAVSARILHEKPGSLRSHLILNLRAF